MLKVRLSGMYGKGRYALVDDQDEDWIHDHTWRLDRYGYVICNFDRRCWFLPQLIVGFPPSGYVTDHIDFNKLNNQRSNLRFLTHQESVDHRRYSLISRSGTEYITWVEREGKWQVRKPGFMYRGFHDPNDAMAYLKGLK